MHHITQYIAVPKESAWPQVSQRAHVPNAYPVGTQAKPCIDGRRLPDSMIFTLFCISWVPVYMSVIV